MDIADGTLATWNNQTVKLRFNFSTDMGGSDAGWWIDDIAITNVQLPGTCLTWPTTAAKPVPDGKFVIGSPMTGAKNGKTVDATWDSATCAATNYNLYWGSLVSGYSAFAGGSCNLGTTGTAAAVPIPADSWWVVAGTSGSEVSSFGRDSAGTEEAFTGWGSGGVCPVATAKNITGVCP